MRTTLGSRFVAGLTWMRGVVAVSLAYFLRRGLGTNLRSTSSLGTIERLLRALLAENIFVLYLGLSRVDAVLELLSAPGRELFTHLSKWRTAQRGSTHVVIPRRATTSLPLSSIFNLRHYRI